MSLQTSFDVLSQITGQFESADGTVRNVEVTASDGDTGVVHASMDVPLSLYDSSGEGDQPNLTPEAATLTGGGTIQIEFSFSELLSVPDTTAATVSPVEQAARVGEDGLRLVVEFTIEPSGDTGGEPSEVDTDSVPADARDLDDATARSVSSPAVAPPEKSEDTDDLEAARDDDLPAYEDTQYLQALYDTCDNFIEMSERIEMDISSETVRRYMVDAGIHEPASYNTSGTADEDQEQDDTAPESEAPPAQSPTPDDDPGASIPDEQLVTDGLGLPENVRLEDVADAVCDSVTVYEVQQCLGLERQQTQKLLKELNLLDLIMRPLAGNPEQPVSYNEVVTRLRKCVPRSTPASA